MKQRIILVSLMALLGCGSARKLQDADTAPAFTIQDVYGNTVDLASLKGKKLVLTFFRSVGCPVCNLYFHELQTLADSFKAYNTQLIAVYESPARAISKYLEDESFYSVMIPDSTEQLYRLYGVQRSWWKAFKSNFTGVYRKRKEGLKLYKQDIENDAHLNRISADFLINEQGKILIAYYGRYIGDHIPADTLLHYIR